MITLKSVNSIPNNNQYPLTYFIFVFDKKKQKRKIKETSYLKLKNKTKKNFLKNIIIKKVGLLHNVSNVTSYSPKNYQKKE